MTLLLNLSITVRIESTLSAVIGSPTTKSIATIWKGMVGDIIGLSDPKGLW